MPPTPAHIFPTGPVPFAAFPSRRSVVHSTKGIVACTQPLAAAAGQRILREGGNAAVGVYILLSIDSWYTDRLALQDAAVAVGKECCNDR